jgi:DNA-binding FadR family transcriptional regulator
MDARDVVAEDDLEVDDGDRVLKTGEAVAQDLRRRIASGELGSGDRLAPEDELMEHFGVARTTLREGLRILESQGLVSIRRGRNGGPRVTTPPVERIAQGFALHLQLEHTTLGDLDEARQLIEPALAARLARHRTQDDLDALAKAIEIAEGAAATKDLRAFGKAATLVHDTIAERGGNRTLALVSAMLHELVEQYYSEAAGRATPDQLEKAVRSYRRLLRLVEASDAVAAAEHWRKHMSFTIDRSDRSRPLDLYGG